jgi:hypothetical protein
MSHVTSRKRFLWLVIFAVAMAYVESAVVVYLREIYYPQGFSFPIVIIPDKMAAIEIGREAATLVMLAGVSLLAGADRWERFLCFCVAFGAWDIFYYVWLRLLLGWPPSLLTWDILFLIPLPWIGPVLAPVIISAAMIAGSLWLLELKRRGTRLGFSRALWALACGGGLVVLLSFMLDHEVAFQGAEPPPFRWGLFGCGVAMGAAALVLGVRRMPGS